MSKMSEERLIEILERVDQGDSIALIMSSYPGESEQIGVVLETVESLSHLASRPYVSAKQASRKAFLAQAAGMQAELMVAYRPAGGWRRLFQALAFTTAALFLLLFGSSILAGAALPGDFLYGPKLALESARLSLTEDPQAILELSGQHQAERLAEVEALLRLKRSAEVEIEGLIELISAEKLIVAGLSVLIDEETQVDGRPQIDELVRVIGVTEDGQLFGRIIIVLTGTPVPDDDEKIMEPTPAPPRPAPANEEPPDEESTPTPTVTTSPSPSPTTTQEPSPTPSPTPLPVPTVDDNPGGGDDGPDGPDEPDDPDEPGDSDETDDPDEPDDSDDPDDSDETDEPDDPDEPEDPDEPGEPDDD
jgi:hypothetical protein